MKFILRFVIVGVLGVCFRGIVRVEVRFIRLLVVMFLFWMLVIKFMFILFVVMLFRMVWLLWICMILKLMFCVLFNRKVRLESFGFIVLKWIF